jgi:predicted nucleotidyltransferase
VATGTDDYEYADEASLLSALGEACEALRAGGVTFIVMGGIASAIWGRPRWTRDVDVFVRLEEAGRALEVLSDAGFETHVEQQHWLSKAAKHGVVVDVISRSHNDILLDEQMLRRASTVTYKGLELPVLAPEDVVVMKAVAASEDTFRYWYDALGIIGRSELDWTYLIARARQAGARRVLALLLYAQSLDILVPAAAIRALVSLVVEPTGATIGSALLDPPQVAGVDVAEVGW